MITVLSYDAVMLELVGVYARFECMCIQISKMFNGLLVFPLGEAVLPFGTARSICSTPIRKSIPFECWETPIGCGPFPKLRRITVFATPTIELTPMPPLR